MNNHDDKYLVWGEIVSRRVLLTTVPTVSLVGVLVFVIVQRFVLGSARNSWALALSLLMSLLLATVVNKFSTKRTVIESSPDQSDLRTFLREYNTDAATEKSAIENSPADIKSLSDDASLMIQLEDIVRKSTGSQGVGPCR